MSRATPAAPARARPRRPTLNLTQWTGSRELWRLVVLLSLPVAATGALQTLLGFVDTRMVSELARYPLAALPALGAGRTLMFFFSSIFMGLGVGITAYVARLSGAGDHIRARQYATVGVLFSGGIGLVIMVLGLVMGEHPIRALVASAGGGVDPATAMHTEQYAWDYMRVMFIGLGAVGVQFALVNVFNAVGRTMLPMWLLVLNNVANFIGNVILIPKHEVAGSAASTVISTLILTAVGVWLLQRDGLIRLSWGGLVNLPRIRSALSRGMDMLRIGAPSAVQVLTRSFAQLTLIKIITYLPMSVVGQGALQVGLQVESIAFMPAFAFSTAAATLVGQNLGARKAANAKTSTYFCLVGSQVVMWTLGLVQFAFPRFFIHLFIGNNAPEVVEPATMYVRVLAACLPGLGLSLTMMGALRGAGDTNITPWISIVAMYLVRLPLAMLLSMKTLGGDVHSIFGLLHLPLVHGLNWGFPGIWWSMTVSVYVEAGLAYLRFRGGAWAGVKLGATHGREIVQRLASDTDQQLARDIAVLEAEAPIDVVIPADPLQTEAGSREPEAVNTDDPE